MSVWDAVVGQPHAVELLTACARRPVHAYLFVGPPGCTKSEAARAFAALLLDPSGDPAGRAARLALAGEHPDVHEVRRVGAAISAEQADEIVRLASRSPVETDRKVLILHEFHLLGAGVAPKLLKTVEEPPDSTVFVILAEDVPPDLVTIASRCVRIDFRPIDPPDIEAALRREGVPPHEAAEAALAAGGDLDRARLLAGDPDLVARRRAFAELPRRLDGTGATVHALVAELLELIDQAMAPLAARHAEEVARLDEHVRAVGERGSGRKDVEARHKREVRRFRTDELKAGLAVVARAYRDALVASPGHRPDALVHAVHDIHEVIGHLDRNPNETLQLQHLLLRLPSLP
jgi:DNA polymerase-3 subunit delta'